MNKGGRIQFGLKTKLKFLLAPNNISEFAYLKGKPKCIVTMAANYGNLGDVAITYAQELFLKDRLPNFEIIDLPINKTITHLKALRNVCGTRDIVTIVGGGFMGDLYPSNEIVRLLIISTFGRSNRIISFPQTADFSDTLAGNYMLKRAQRVYSFAKNLELWAREERSYMFMKTHFPANKVFLTPDIVMSLDQRGDTTGRKGITFCLRRDKEKNSRTDDLISAIQREVKDENVTYYDTHIGNVRLSCEERITELNKIWEHFRHSRLVITDRLHGMIFAFITGTPAIVLPGNNPKIEDSYKWIKDCGYIKMINANKGFNANDLSSLTYTEHGFDTVHHKIMNVFNSISI